MDYIDSKEDRIKLDKGLFFGKGLFETILVKERAIFLEEHINRINNSCKILNIEKYVEYNDVLNFIEKNNIKNKALKITITDKNIIYSTRDIQYKSEDYKRGFSICLSSVLRNSTSMLVYVKSTCYIENIMEKNKGKNLGFDEIIFLNEKGYIAEGATSNIFFIKNNKIFTPKVKCGILNGIVRQWVVDNFIVEEGEYKIEDLLMSDAIFITNSIVGIMKVCEIEGKKFNSHDKIEEIINCYKTYIK